MKISPAINLTVAGCCALTCIKCAIDHSTIGYIINLLAVFANTFFGLLQIGEPDEKAS